MTLVDKPLFSDENEGQGSTLLAALQGFWADGLDQWSFWARWYDGVLKGEPLPWEVQRAVALIPDEDWEKGPAWIAEKIREIEAGFGRRDFDGDELTKQATALAKRPGITVFLCRSIADEVRAATQINNLPEEFRALCDLPPIFDLIAELVQSKAEISELEATVAELGATIERLTQDLASATGKSRTDLFLDKVATTSATVLTTGFWALLGGGISHALGFLDAGEIVDRFGLAVDGLPLQSPMDAPTESDGAKFVKPPEK